MLPTKDKGLSKLRRLLGTRRSWILEGRGHKLQRAENDKLNLYYFLLPDSFPFSLHSQYLCKIGIIKNLKIFLPPLQGCITIGKKERKTKYHSSSWTSRTAVPGLVGKYLGSLRIFLDSFRIIFMIKDTNAT